MKNILNTSIYSKKSLLLNERWRNFVPLFTAIFVCLQFLPFLVSG